jgi:trehalose 6-phosphate synthase/phosphatase
MRLPSAIAGEAVLRSKHAGRMIIAGLDSAQYLSGVELKLSVYEMLLHDSPTWRDKLVLVQRCLIPGARRLDEANTIRKIRILVNQIKSKYGDAVIDYEEVIGSTLQVDQRLALWRAADCLLNTEVRCGLNLWPLEFVFAQKGLDLPGIVISSEFSAVFGILNGALRINPFDMKLTLATIDKALTMSQGQREERHLRDIEFVSSSSSAKWIKNILRDLKELIDDHTNEESDNEPSDIPNVAEFLASERDDQFTCLDPKSVVSAYNTSSRRVIILDFNGTIVIKEDVDSYLKRDDIGSTGDAPPQAVCESLAKLAADPQNTVFVVSESTE